MEEKKLEDYRGIKKNKFKTRIGMIFLSLTLGSSLTITKLEYDLLKEKYVLERLEEHEDENYIETIESKEFNIPKIKIDNVYTKKELNHIKKIEINLIDNMDYSYLNELTNLEELIINDYSTKPLLDNVDGSVFKNKMKIKIYRKNYEQAFTEERYKFLKDIPYIDSLVLGKPKGLYLSPNKTLIDELYQKYKLAHNFSISFNIESNFLESLTNIHNLTLAVDETLSYKYTDLTFLESLTIEGEPYDVAIFFSSKNLRHLIYSGVDVSYEDYDKLTEINKELDKIVDSFNLPKDAPDIDKINSALLYTLDKCEYPTKDEYKDKAFFVSEANKYYYNGYLRGVFERDKQICGNFTALFTALLNRLNIDSYLLFSQTHTWNIVKNEDKYYIFDTTWTDNTEVETIKKSYYTLNENGIEELCKDYDKIPDVEVARIVEEKVILSVRDIIEKYPHLSNSLNWYMANPMNSDQYHIPAYIPADLMNNSEIKNINIKNIEYFSISEEGAFFVGTINATLLVMILYMLINCHKDLIVYKKREKELVKEYNKD